MKASILLLASSLGLFAAGFNSRPADNRRQPELNFGRDVKPILIQHCFKCHGPDAAKAAAGLRLDSFAGITAKLSDGYAVVPGHPEKSKLIERVSATDPANRMPPTFASLPALTPEEVDVLRRWIVSGAHYAKHWAFVPPAMPAMPSVRKPGWCKNLVDRFVLAKMESEGLEPEPEADRDTLALRASQTLTGLPPTQVELNAFRNDKKPGAYERFVDRMLSKPEYGEQEARYWLDAVRYADTHGLQLDNERGFYPYRDWVVRAFNEDLPYDKFAKWQLAGDMLPHPTTEQLIATGYVRANLTSNEGGAIAEEFLARNTFDRTDTTGTTFLGLTVGCAKCHDHKFDPIKQTDYYGLYAFFDSTQDEPLDGNALYPPPVMKAPTPEQASQLAQMQRQLDKLSETVDPKAADFWFAKNRQPLPAARDWMVSPVYSTANFDEAFDKPEPGEPGQPDAQWKPLKFELGKASAGLVGRDSASVYVRGTLVSRSARSLTLRVSSDDGVRVWLNGKLIHSNKVNRGVDQAVDTVRAELRAGDNQLVAKVINGAGPDGLRISLSDALDERIDKAVAAFHKAPSDPAAVREMRDVFLEGGPATKEALEYRKGLKAKSEFDASIPMTLIAREMPKPRPTFVLKRGQYDQKGEAVERHIPAALGQLPPGAPRNRLGFAEWLTAPKNPLFARVFVNRIWQQHFGVGIVKTSEDFGSQGEWPEDQALLDYLAVSFMKNGYSVKELNRLIVTSAAFRQSSRISAEKLAKDPENRLIDRGPRFRLDAEEIRDKALACGGLLVEQIGGHGVKPYQPEGLWEAASDPESGTHKYVRDHGAAIYRRSLYLFWKRTSPPPVMVTLDAPLRDTCIVRRSRTNTPLQALTTLNETALLEASRTMAERLLTTPGDDAKRIKSAYETAMCRPPKPIELSIFEKALARYRLRYKDDPRAAAELTKVGDAPQPKNEAAPEQAAWMLVCSTLMNTDEFFTQH